jgi:hypothetical protein
MSTTEASSSQSEKRACPTVDPVFLGHAEKSLLILPQENYRFALQAPKIFFAGFRVGERVFWVL